MCSVLLQQMQLQLLRGESPLIAEGALVALWRIAILKLLAQKEELKDLAIVYGFHRMIILVLISGLVLILIITFTAIGHLCPAHNTLVSPAKISTCRTAQTLAGDHRWSWRHIRLIIAIITSFIFSYTKYYNTKLYLVYLTYLMLFRLTLINIKWIVTTK